MWGLLNCRLCRYMWRTNEVRAVFSGVGCVGICGGYSIVGCVGICGGLMR